MLLEVLWANIFYPLLFQTYIRQTKNHSSHKNLFARYPLPNYFQQEVDYTIQVKLDDEKNMLRATESMVYINNSPDTLKFDDRSDICHGSTRLWRQDPASSADRDTFHTTASLRS